MRGLFYWLVGANTGTDKQPAVSFGLLVLRLGTGLMMAFGHGWGKFSTFGERAAHFADPFGLGPGLSLSLAVFAELFCSIALALGLFTRGVVIPLIITMLTAGLIIHGDDPWQRKELAFLYLVPLLTLFFTGAGSFSIDRVIGRK